jgi:hypothetical protein
VTMKNEDVDRLRECFRDVIEEWSAGDAIALREISERVFNKMGRPADDRQLIECFCNTWIEELWGNAAHARRIDRGEEPPLDPQPLAR